MPRHLHRAKDSIDNPHKLAAGFLSAFTSNEKSKTLYSWNDMFVEYQKGAYHIRPLRDIQTALTSYIREAFVREIEEESSKRKWTRTITTSLLSNTLNALRSLCHLASSIEPPAWLGNDTNHPDPLSMLSMANGILNLPKLYSSTDCPLLPCSADYFTFAALPFEYVAQVQAPLCWNAFLKSLWPDDSSSIACLQEWFGYLLTCDTRLHKMLMLIGPKRSGKGTILRILTQVVGEKSVVNPTLASLATQFGLAPLLGKSVAIVPDARLSNRADQAVVLERLLSISGEDAQTIDRKHRDPITCKLATRFVLASNELPRVLDTSGAFSGRLILLKLTHSFYGREDTELVNKLTPELPGIFQWALAGLIRLQARGCFIQPQSGLELTEELEDLVSPVGAFVREKCVIDPKATVEVGELYELWKEWCAEQGRQNPGPLQTFGRDLHAAVPSVSVIRPVLNGKRVRFYQGLRSLQAGEVTIPSAQSAVSSIAPSLTFSLYQEGQTALDTQLTRTADCADGTLHGRGFHEL
ncbi:MAG: phage/plasmid primase, P4 family [Gemmatales bacterium]